jgi:hypothetical protein
MAQVEPPADCKQEALESDDVKSVSPGTGALVHDVVEQTIADLEVQGSDSLAND